MSVDPDPALAEVLDRYAGLDWAVLDPIESRNVARFPLAQARVAELVASPATFRPELFRAEG